MKIEKMDLVTKWPLIDRIQEGLRIFGQVIFNAIIKVLDLPACQLVLKSILRDPFFSSSRGLKISTNGRAPYLQGSFSELYFLPWYKKPFFHMQIMP